MFIITIVSSYSLYYFICKKGKQNSIARKAVVGVFSVIVIVLSVIFVFLPFMARITTRTIRPQNQTAFETVTIDNKNYVVICNSSNGKIIMEYFQNESDEIFIDNSSYQYLQLQDSKVIFKYKHFSSVQLDK